jgi:hypothetical protein
MGILTLLCFSRIEFWERKKALFADAREKMKEDKVHQDEQRVIDLEKQERKARRQAKKAKAAAEREAALKVRRAQFQATLESSGPLGKVRARFIQLGILKENALETKLRLERETLAKETGADRAAREKDRLTREVLEQQARDVIERDRLEKVNLRICVRFRVYLLVNLFFH